MRLLDIFPRFVCTLVILFFLSARASGYFVITQPNQGSQLVNRAASQVIWRKGLADSIREFDVELLRLSGGGLNLIAKSVPTSQFSFDIFLDDMPPGDDYFLVFINTTHGVRYATSQRFAILPAPSDSANQTIPSPTSAGLTLTASGTPNPTRQFATTLPATFKSGSHKSLGDASHAWALATLVSGFVFGVLCTLR